MTEPPVPSVYSGIGGRFYFSLVVVLAGLALLPLSGCGSASGSDVVEATVQQPADISLTLTLGDVEAADPTRKYARSKLLADHLAASLKEFGIEAGDVVLAENIEDMVRLLRHGTVDIYLDGAFPTLVVQELSGSQVVLRRWKDQDPEYWSTFVALRGNGSVLW